MPGTESTTVLEYLQKEGKCVLPIKGGSMRPLLRDDPSLVEVTLLKGEPEKDDVILFRAGEELILHRLVGKNARGYVARGDNRLSCERGIARQDVFGVMTAYASGKKMKKPRGFFYRAYVLFWCRKMTVRKIVWKLRSLLRGARKNRNGG